MPDPREQTWDFGSLDAPEDKRSADRNLLEKTRQATSTVGYRAPDQQIVQPPAPVSEVRAKKAKTGRPKKGRTVALSTKISPEQDAMLKAIASDGFVIADIIEDVLVNYAQTLKSTGRYKRFPLSDESLAAIQVVLDARLD